MVPFIPIILSVVASCPSCLSYQSVLLYLLAYMFLDCSLHRPFLPVDLIRLRHDLSSAGSILSCQVAMPLLSRMPASLLQGHSGALPKLNVVSCEHPLLPTYLDTWESILRILFATSFACHPTVFVLVAALHNTG